MQYKHHPHPFSSGVKRSQSDRNSLSVDVIDKDWQSRLAPEAQQTIVGNLGGVRR